MHETKTFWIARDLSVSGCEESVSIFTARPRLAGGGVWLCDSDADSGWIPPELFDSVGLPQEPAPGECWEVTWEPISVLRLQSDRNDAMLPTARNVTDELKERTDG